MEPLSNQFYNTLIIKPLSLADQVIHKCTKINYGVVRLITDIALSILAVALTRQGLLFLAHRFYPHLLPRITAGFKVKLALMLTLVFLRILNTTDDDRKKITDPGAPLLPPNRSTRTRGTLPSQAQQTRVVEVSHSVDFFKDVLSKKDFSFLHDDHNKKEDWPLLLQAAQELAETEQKPIGEILNQVDLTNSTLFWTAIRSGHRDRCDIMAGLIKNKIDVNKVDCSLILVNDPLTMSVILQLIHKNLLNETTLTSIKDKWNKRLPDDRKGDIEYIKNKKSSSLGLEVTDCSFEDLQAVLTNTFDDSGNWK